MYPDPALPEGCTGGFSHARPTSHAGRSASQRITALPAMDRGTLKRVIYEEDLDDDAH